MCEELRDASEATIMAGRLRTALAEGIRIGETTVVVQASIGVAVGAPGSSPLDLLEEADAEMYQAKARTDSRNVVKTGRR